MEQIIPTLIVWIVFIGVQPMCYTINAREREREEGMNLQQVSKV